MMHSYNSRQPTRQLHQTRARQDKTLEFYNVLCRTAIALERLGILNASQIFIVMLMFWGVCHGMHLEIRGDLWELVLPFHHVDSRDLSAGHEAGHRTASAPQPHTLLVYFVL